MWGAIKKAINSNLNKSLDVLIQEKVTETNGKVDSKANQTSVDGIDTKIGATNNTGGTASAGSIFAKLNTLLTDWTTTRAGYIDNINTKVDSLVNGKVVKSVQRGFFSGSSTKTPAGVLINHNAVDLNKSLLFVSGFKANYAGSGLITASRSSTNFLMEGSSTTTYAYEFSWELIEFY